MAENFMTGFASGFVRARERTEDRKQEQEQVMFKYKMDSLVSQKELRTKKQAQEKEWQTQAETLAQIHGDPDFKQTAIVELKNKVPYETLQKRIGEGAYSTNDKYATPTQTVKVPTAVSQPMNVDPTSIGGTQPYVDPVVASGKPVVEPKTSFKDKRQQQLEERVNERIGQIDPSLLNESASDDDYSSTLEANATNPKYLYKPKNEMKLGAYQDAVYELTKAQTAGDPKAIIEAKSKVEAHEQALTMKAKIEARAKGEDVRTYVSLNEDGTMGKQFPGVVRDGVLKNIADPMSGPTGGAEVTGRVQELSEEQWKRLNTLRDNFGKKKGDVDVQTGSLISAMDSSQKLTQLLQSDPDAGTSVYRGIGVVDRLGREVGAVFQAVQDADVQIQALAEKGDMEGVGSLIRNQAKNLQQLEQAAGKASIVGDVNQQKIINSALFNSYKISAAYQFAQAALEGGKLSNQDFENNLARIGGDGSLGPEATIAALNSAAQESFIKVEGARNNLNKDPSITGFEIEMFGESKGQTGLKSQRIGEIIMEQFRGDDNRTRALMQYLGKLDGTYKAGQAQTQESITPKVEIQPGEVRKGYMFKGGDPSDKNNWEKK